MSIKAKARGFKAIPRDAHAPQPNAHGDKPFSFFVDGRVYSDRVKAAPAFTAVIDRGVDESFAAGRWIRNAGAPLTPFHPSDPIVPVLCIDLPLGLNEAFVRRHIESKPPVARGLRCDLVELVDRVLAASARKDPFSVTSAIG